MKNTLITIAVLNALLLPAASLGQGRYGGVAIDEPAINKDGEVVNVSFCVRIDSDAVPRDHSLVLGPELTDGIYRWSLPVIIVHGKGARTSFDRQILATGNGEKFRDAFFSGNGSTFEYLAVVPYQEWMEGAELTVESLEVGRRITTAGNSGTLAEDIRLTPQPEAVQLAVQLPNPEPETIPAVTTGELLSRNNRFVLPLPPTEHMEPGSLFNGQRENTVTVHYAQGKYDIDPSFGDNRQELSLLNMSIQQIHESTDSEVALVVIAGFASPEGSFEFNDRLAWNRAHSLKEYLLANTGLETGRIEIFNGSEDWQGLRMLVEASAMDKRDAVLRIIDTVPIWDITLKVGRLGELMRLDGGRPYRYMYEHFFPQLRNSGYIRVYYRDLEE